MKIDVSTYCPPNTGLDVTAGLVQAIAAASPGDTLFFPNGVYLHTGLTISTANLTLDLERGAVLKKMSTPSSAPPLDVLASGTRIYGGTFEDTPGNAEQHMILALHSGVGHSLDIAGLTVLNARSFGIVGGESDMKLMDCVVRDSYHGGVYWNASASRIGPHVERVKVFKGDLSKYGSHGGIHIRTSGMKPGTSEMNYSEGMIIRDCHVELPEFNPSAPAVHLNNAGIDCWQGRHALMAGNFVKFGRMAYSFGTCISWRASANSCHKPGDYGYEFSDCHYGSMTGNTGIGFGAGVSRGVEMSGSAAGAYTTGNTFADNRFIGFAADYFQGPGCGGNSIL
jgi:hypothetical protein